MKVSWVKVGVSKGKTFSKDGTMNIYSYEDIQQRLAAVKSGGLTMMTNYEGLFLFKFCNLV